MKIKQVEIINKEILFNHIPQEQIIASYYSDFEFGIQRSPLRDDNIPSFSFFYGRSGDILFKDFAEGDSGDIIKFISKLYQISYREALLKISSDYNIIDKNIKELHRINFTKKVKSKTKIEIKVKFDNWNNEYLNYWKQYGITPEILDKYKVYPIKEVYYNNYATIIKFGFCYIEEKDNKISYKIYQPYNKENKWINNNDYSVWEGWSQLPENGDLLIWTKSRKDVMTIVSNSDINAIACQAESVIPKDHIVDQLKQRFKKIILFYDNDYDGTQNWGLNHVKKLSKEFNLDYIMIPENYKAKDYSDFYKKYGKEESTKFLNNKINEIK